MLQRFRLMLRSQQGSVLIDSMVAIIVTSLVVGSLAALSVNASRVIAIESINTSRHIALQTIANDEAVKLNANPNLYNTDGTTAVFTVGDSGPMSVTIWRTEPQPGNIVLNAAVSRWYPTGDRVCTNPSAVDYSTCWVSTASIPVRVDPTSPVSAAVPVTWTPTTVAGGTPTAVSAGSTVGSFTRSAAVTVLYVVKVSSAAGPGTLVFRDGTTVLATLPFDSVMGTRYLYGSVAVPAGVNVTVASTGATVSLSRFYVYEVS
jgi:hypothetical protein